MGLVITWSLVIHMPFIAVWGTLHQTVSMKSSSCNPQEKRLEPPTQR